MSDDFGITKYVKTNKPHRCVYCQRLIPKGNTMRHYKGLWEGDWQNHYTCGFCERTLDLSEEEISGDEFQDWFREITDFDCTECEGRMDYEWISLTQIELECEECDHTKIIEIPID